MSLNHTSTGSDWAAQSPESNREYVVSMSIVLTKINDQGRTIDGEILYRLTEEHFSDARKRSENVLEVMAKFIREYKVG